MVGAEPGLVSLPVGVARRSGRVLRKRVRYSLDAETAELCVSQDSDRLLMRNRGSCSTSIRLLATRSDQRTYAAVLICFQKSVVSKTYIFLACAKGAMTSCSRRRISSD
jgi:hypothetical protein